MSDELLARAEREAAFYDKKPTMFTTGTLLRDLAARVRELEARVTDQQMQIDASCNAEELRQARERAERAEAEALGWERKNAQNVGKYEREADALRALLSDIRAEGRITGNIAKRLISALGDRHD